MRTAVMMILLALFAFTAHARDDRRLSAAQIRATVQETRARLQNHPDAEARRQELRRLHARLQGEFDKGAASFDETFVYVNKVLLDLENILHNDCRKSRDLLVNQTLGADPNLRQRDRVQREMSEGLALHASYCRR